MVWGTLRPSATAAPFEITLPTPLRGSAATEMNVAWRTTGARVYVNAQGVAAP